MLPSPLAQQTASDIRAESIPTTGRVRWTAALARPAARPASVRLRGLSTDGAWLAGCQALLAGVGAAGGPVAEGLIRCGVPLTFVDPDEFGPDSWRTQWCVAADAGVGKVDRLLNRLQTVNPHVALRAGRGWIQDVPWRMVADADVLLTAGDNLQMVVAQGRLAAAFGKPLVQAAVHGESLSAIVRCWDLRNQGAACPACALGEADWGGLAVRRGCDVKSLHVGGATPTQTVPCVCVTAGQMAVAETLRLLADAAADRLGRPAHSHAGASGPPARETLLTLDTFRSITTPLERNAHCRCPHRRWDLATLTDGPDRISFEDVLARSPFAARSDRARLEVSSELPWCQFTTCPRCRRGRSIGRFASPGDSVGICDCGGPLTARPLGLRHVIPWDDLTQRAGRPLAEAGLPPGRAIVIDDGDAPPWCGFVGPLADVPDFRTGSPAADS